MVSYDFDRKLMDLRFLYADDPNTKAVELEGSWQRPALRFVYLPTKALMWNPGAAKQCGTPWVNFPYAYLRRTFGLDPRVLFLRTDAAHALNVLRSRPRVVRHDAVSTTFQVLVNGDAGVATSSLTLSHPAKMAQLKRRTATAHVLVPLGRGGIEISVDVTNAYAFLAGTPSRGVSTVVQWFLERPARPLDITVPTKIAPTSCLS